MWKVTSKGLLAHKLRLALTALAIVLGVTFISGTFVLTDTLHNTFTTLFNRVYQNVDFQVRRLQFLSLRARVESVLDVIVFRRGTLGELSAGNVMIGQEQPVCADERSGPSVVQSH